jgi:4-amino-4-deoxy-L-arabinose transferase-like glycosyltransferase
MIKKFILKNWLLIIILIIAAFFRFYQIGDYMEFLGDQGRDVSIIRNLFKHGDLFFIGPQTSIGNMYLGPYFYYLIAPSLWLANYSPVGPAIFIALIGLATVFLIYFVCQRWFNKNIGLIAAFLFAISPVVIKYSNFIWNPNIMPFFALLFIFLFFEALRLNQYRLFAYASLAFVMVINSHYLGLALLPIVGVFWIFSLIKFIKTKSKFLKPFLINTLIAVVIFIISLTPQVLFDIKHQGQNVKALISFFTYRETTINIKPYKALPGLPAMFDQVNTSLVTGNNTTVGIIISIVFTIGLIFYIFKKPHPKNISFWVVFLWYFVGLISLALYKQHIYNHYFGFLFPVVFILIAILINKFKFFGFLSLILITVFSLLNNPFRWPPNNQLATVQQIDDSIIQKSDSQKYNFALLAKQNYDPPYTYLLTQKDPTKLVSLQDQVTDQLFVVCEPFQMDCNPINNPEWSVAAFGWAKIDSQWEINGIKVFKLVHTQTTQNKLK